MQVSQAADAAVQFSATDGEAHGPGSSGPLNPKGKRKDSKDNEIMFIASRAKNPEISFCEKG